MSRVLTFSTVFPSYRPRAGQPTYFVEKLWRAMLELKLIGLIETVRYESNYQQFFPCQFTPEENIVNHTPKYHTIRAGHRWKVGDKFSPRVWSGKAYRSKQVIIGPDIEVKKVWDIEKHHDFFMINGNGVLAREVSELAKNDGLDELDLRHWFGKEPKFSGQIICWNDKIEY
jgi:hypothetical protein